MTKMEERTSDLAERLDRLTNNNLEPWQHILSTCFPSDCYRSSTSLAICHRFRKKAPDILHELIGLSLEFHLLAGLMHKLYTCKLLMVLTNGT